MTIGTEAPAPIDQDATDELLGRLLDLNNAHEIELSRLGEAGLRRLLAEAFFARRIGLLEAFLISFDQDARYDGVNFQWFRTRYDRFVYIDRVVVAGGARGRGHAGRLYAALFEQARAAGYHRVVCEVNAEPPNVASAAFHTSLGFEGVGEAAIHGGAKTVRYLSLGLR